jgi:L-methionine (R)-S-oxide reductase
MDDKKAIYGELIRNFRSLCESEPDLIANLANLSALLKESFGFHWCGAYLVRGNELVLGPFQGPVACTRIARGKGVCGTAWDSGTTLVVEDVDKFPGHIACSPHSRSEIVVPFRQNDGQVCGVIDIDSDQLASFDQVDAMYLEEVAKLVQANSIKAVHGQ